MITTLAVAGYRSLRDVVVPLHPLDVVTGANGSGKSSLYRALRLLADCGSGRVTGSLARSHARWLGWRSSTTLRHAAPRSVVCCSTGPALLHRWVPGCRPGSVHNFVHRL